MADSYGKKGSYSKFFSTKYGKSDSVVVLSEKANVFVLEKH